MKNDSSFTFEQSYTMKENNVYFIFDTCDNLAYSSIDLENISSIVNDICTEESQSNNCTQRQRAVT